MLSNSRFLITSFLPASPTLMRFRELFFARLGLSGFSATVPYARLRDAQGF
jgi:hypothetical protein